MAQVYIDGKPAFECENVTISECVGKKRKPWDDIDPYESLVITW